MKLLLLLITLTLAELSAASDGEKIRPSVSRQEADLLERAVAVAETNLLLAVEWLDEARTRTGSSAALDYSAGNLHARREAYAQAERAYRDALEKKPGFFDAQLGLGRVLSFQGKWEAAEKILRRLAQDGNATEPILLLYAHVLLESGRVLSAESVYRQALLAGGESPDALYGMARCFLMQERYRECEAVMRELVQLRPGNQAFWTLLADVQRASGKDEAASVTLETSRRLGVASPAMLILLGELYVHQGALTQATEVFSEALERDPSRLELSLRIAEGWVSSGELERAGALLDSYAVRAEILEATYHRVRAQWAERSGRTDVARAAYLKWIALDPLDEQALLALGDLLYDEGEAGEAELWYQRTRNAHPERPAAWLRLARIALDREQYAEAEKLLERAQVLNGDASIGRTLQQIRRLHALSE